jgi:chromosome segregation ATPase
MNLIFINKMMKKQLIFNIILKCNTFACTYHGSVSVVITYLKIIYMTEQKLDLILHEVTEVKNLAVTKFRQIEADIAQLKADVATLKADVASLKVDVTILKSDVAELKTEVVQIKADIARLDNRMKIMDIRLSLIEQRLSNIEPWISVNNKQLHFDPATHTAA